MALDDEFGQTPEEAMNHWQDWANFVVATWLFASPWVLQYADGTGNLQIAAWNDWVVAALVALCAIGAVVALAPWEERANMLLGAWLFLSPWTLAFSDATGPAWNNWVVGILVFAFALSNRANARAVGPSRALERGDLAHAGDRPRDPMLRDSPFH